MMMDTIVIDGFDVADMGWILTDQTTLGNPEPKRLVVDIPGADGAIDLTEALLGDVPYGTRVDTLGLAYQGDDPVGAVYSLLQMVHGRRLSYVLSFDAEYTRTGRFSVGTPTYTNNTATLSMTAMSDPYKVKDSPVVTIAAGGGASVSVQSGRRTVKPRILTRRDTIVVVNGVAATLRSGEWTSPLLVFREGVNDVYANSTPTGGDLPWSHWSTDTDTTNDVAVSAIAGMRYGDLCWSVKPTGDAYDVVISYEWSDL